MRAIWIGAGARGAHHSEVDSMIIFLGKFPPAKLGEIAVISQYKMNKREWFNPLKLRKIVVASQYQKFKWFR